MALIKRLKTLIFTEAVIKTDMALGEKLVLLYSYSIYFFIVMSIFTFISDAFIIRRYKRLRKYFEQRNDIL